MTDEGLVGQVTKVTRDQSRVTLLTDKESAVSAYDIRTEAYGVDPPRRRLGRRPDPRPRPEGGARRRRTTWS